MRYLTTSVIVLMGLCCFAVPARGDEPLRIATFNVDATPPIGSPVAYALTRKIDDSLSARGIVLMGQDKPIVLCAVDWIGIANSGHDQWREALARAAGTTRDRVTLHALHQHDGPRCDFAAAALLEQRGMETDHFDVPFTRKTIDRCVKAIKVAVAQARPVTHLGVGKAMVEKVASNRRILGSDGKVRVMRWSSCTDPATIAEPEGLIDPWVRLLSFWNGDEAIAMLSYYATHPMSHYGQGDVSADFVGLARSLCEAKYPGLAIIHFSGAGGNIAAGKYNDGSERMRPILAQRLADGMQRAWESTVKTPIVASDMRWRVKRVRLPIGSHLVEPDLLAILDDTNAEATKRLGAASHLAWLQRHNSGHETEISCLDLGAASVLHLPGELFVEYQIAAQAFKPNSTVCMAAYGDYGPGYIGTEIAYAQGGYETSPGASRVAPQVEGVLMAAMKELLDKGQEINQERLKELDAFWSEVSRCVNEGDYEGYRATCHPDGVLVAGTRGEAYPLTKALMRWHPGFIDTKSGKIKASVSFRFSQRLGDETTAHETGIFLYSTVNADGNAVRDYIHFEALLIKRKDWKIMMEYQKSRGTEEEWNKFRTPDL